MQYEVQFYEFLPGDSIDNRELISPFEYPVRLWRFALIALSSPFFSFACTPIWTKGSHSLVKLFTFSLVLSDQCWDAILHIWKWGAWGQISTQRPNKGVFVMRLNICASWTAWVLVVLNIGNSVKHENRSDFRGSSYWYFRLIPDWFFTECKHSMKHSVWL